MASTVSATDPHPVKRKRAPRPAPIAKCARLFQDRAAWMLGHWRQSGGPCWLVPGDTGTHHTDLLTCTCERRKFMRHGPEQACNHTQAVRLWFTAARLGQVSRHPRGEHVALAETDWAAFLEQDLVLAAVADSLLIQFDLRAQMSVAQRDRHDGRPVWLAPGDTWDGAEITDDTPAPASRPDGLAAQLAREEAETRRLRTLALVDPTAAPDVAYPPDERP